MKNIESICAEFGLQIPEDKKADFLKAVHENYKTKEEFDKKIERLNSDIDNWKGKAETAETTLKNFDGVDVEKMKSDIADWKKKAEDAEKEYTAKINARDRKDLLMAEIEKMAFTNPYAKKVISDYLEASENINIKNGKLYGLTDVLEDAKKEFADAFLTEGQQNAQQNQAGVFTGRFQQNASGGNLQKKFSEMTLTEKMKLKAENPTLYESIKNNG